ncbi:MAG: 23S rRNA (guanosine(2251)-2'-O)-methyltransferase RlmB [Phototrophicales bacterium]
MPDYLYGHWAVMEALRANRRHIEQLLLADKTDDRGIIGEIVQIAHVRDVPVRRVPRTILDDLAHGANHQNTILRTRGYVYVDVQDILQIAAQRQEKPFILILDLLQDPQNVGSLMRVADAVGVHGVILQERRGVGITPSVVNASSGAVEHLNVAQVTNLVNTMKDLKKQDIWMVGLDIGENTQPLNSVNLDMGLGLVVGSEGDGMRRLVRETCDLVLTLPMRGRVGSLNAATAGSVVLYKAWEARNWQGWKQGEL